VWVDDSFMGTAVISHSLPFLQNRQEYQEYAAQQILGFYHHLRHAPTGLMHHGYDAQANVQSCCLWGRGNGWALSAAVDLLLAMDRTSPSYQALLANFTALAAAVLKYQGTDGRWHNLINDTTTVPETSCTAFFVYAYIKGIMHGLLPSSPYTDAATRGWQGIVSQIGPDGSIENIIGETGIKVAAKDYAPRKMLYENAAPGVGAVLRAAAAAVAFGL
jgi:rhamnogalacturonyl hydrolase YesR